MSDLTALRDLIPLLEKATAPHLPNKSLFWEVADALCGGRQDVPDDAMYYIDCRAWLHACLELQSETLPNALRDVSEQPDGWVAVTLHLPNGSYTGQHAIEALAWLLAIVHAVIAQEEGK